MFLRKVTIGGKQYIRLVENYREDGKVKQRFLATLGRVDQISKQQALNMIEKLRAWYDVDDVVNVSNVKSNVIKNYGAKLVVDKLFEEYELDEYLSKVDKKVRYDLESMIKLMVMNRLLEPKSKLGIYNELDYYGIEDVELHQIYRSLDILARKKEEIEKYMYNKRLNLFNSSIDLIFYDVTTLSFESQQVNGLMNYGYSKDKKFNETQVVLGMSVDRDRFPVSFNIYEGNKFEGHTMKDAIEEMKSKYNLSKVIVVADRGMLSEGNITAIEESGYDYIVGRSIKKLSDDVDIFKLGYKEIATGIEVAETEYKGKRLIVVRSDERASKDFEERERQIEKAKKMIKNHTVDATTKRGAMKYVKEEHAEKGTYELNIEKIEEDARYDGYYGIITNTQEQAKAIIEEYHSLWEVEESFRTLKGFLKARPIYHWTVRRITGHMVMVFISYVLLKTMEKKLKRSGIEYTHEKIRESLRKMEYAEMKIEGKRLEIRTNLNEYQRKMLKALGIEEPKKVRIIDVSEEKSVEKCDE